MMSRTCLSGIVILERADRSATALCGALLAQLGATVVRFETATPGFDDLTAAAAEQALATARAGKICFSPPGHAGPSDAWLQLVARADVVLLTPTDLDDRLFVEKEASSRIICSITDYGLQAGVGASGDLAFQAQAGIMACTGALGGVPEALAIPVIEMLTAINSATAIVSALRVLERDGRSQLIDMAALDCALALLQTFISNVAVGQSGGYRLGAGHHLAAPWNAYRTVDGWIQVCSFNDSQWERVARVIGRADIARQEKFKDSTNRVVHVHEIDGMVGAWTRHVSTETAYMAFMEAGVPAGKIRSIPQLIADAGMIHRGIVRTRTGKAPIAGSFFRFSRSPAMVNEEYEQHSDFHIILARLGPRSAARIPIGQAKLPLSGIRVLEIGPNTAGPLAGRYLSDLGAEVIKVEPPGGEVSRKLQPQIAGWSGYFVNCNIGKKFIDLDLNDDADRAIFLNLAGQADVVIENLKPGATDRLGVGPKALLSSMPRLVVCSISGFGAEGPERPALDTVVQAEAGLMSLVGDGKAPHRVGISIADQGAAHVAPLAIIAALRYRDVTGEGQTIDLSMHDIITWMTQLNWPDGSGALRPWQQVAASDGWCLVKKSDDQAQADGLSATSIHTREELVEALRQDGISAVPVNEMDEVFKHEAIQRRELINRLGSGDVMIQVLRAPYRLGLTPPTHGRMCAVADADRQDLLERIGSNANRGSLQHQSSRPWRD